MEIEQCVSKNRTPLICIMLSKFSWSFHTLGMVAIEWTNQRGCLEPHNQQSGVEVEKNCFVQSIKHNFEKDICVGTKRTNPKEGASQVTNSQAWR